PRARDYMRLEKITGLLGTAVNVQTMVFGNRGSDCATGVAFTRNPATGERRVFGEYLTNAQGEDVVAGIRTPKDIVPTDGHAGLAADFPEAHRQLEEICARLERHFRDMQDVEFTIQHGTLYMLQTRAGKRTGPAAIRIAVEMVEEGLLDEREALGRVQPEQVAQLLAPEFAAEQKKQAVAEGNLLAKGLPAGPGAASGKIALTADRAAEMAASGPVLLVRAETSPEDIVGMHASAGILTSRGGMTSHAAVVARGMGKPCVAGAGDVRIDAKAGTLVVRGTTVSTGDTITLDGSTGEIILGTVPTVQPEMSGDFAELMKWADEVRTLGIRTNADTPTDAAQARKFGAEGIGLCRTEHMFFEGDRILAVREMILADDETGRRAALAKLLPMQRHDFAELFTIMSGLPVTIRLLDPPLHEFLPHTEAEIAEVATAMATSPDKLKRRAAELHEFNPMLGFRGCRLAIAYPEIAEMQARAIFEAAVEAQKTTGAAVVPEIMVPLVVTRAEFDLVKERIDAMAAAVASETGTRVSYQTGTMIELPRACLVAHEIAETAEFFSFGTNDLTQTALGISRDDAATFLGTYTQKGILASDPFVTIDQDGVGELVRIGVERGRRTRPDIKLGICGEHGGDPASVRFCSEVGLDYVSCSPYRVPIARLAAAQAALGGKVASQA
ncbi:MAG: pyruvate, phosphate dikinase, partial [Microvirga sp.]